jgi:hypothetical protein
VPPPHLAHDVVPSWLHAPATAGQGTCRASATDMTQPITLCRYMYEPANVHQESSIIDEQMYDSTPVAAGITISNSCTQPRHCTCCSLLECVQYTRDAYRSMFLFIYAHALKFLHCLQHYSTHCHCIFVSLSAHLESSACGCRSTHGQSAKTGNQAAARAPDVCGPCNQQTITIIAHCSH